MTDEPNDSKPKENYDETRWAPPDMRPEEPAGYVPPTPPPIKKAPETFRMSFTGMAGEYFRIWIVNLCLTIITLGIYLPWAIVRQRKYLYANTWLGEDNFGFHANPVALLKGYLVVFAFAIIYSAGAYFNPIVSIAVFLLFLALLPFLVRNAIRFRSRNSSYRNIRFNFHGTLGVAYQRYMLWPILIALSFGLLAPYVAYLKKDYLMNNLGFGNQGLEFRGEGGKFYPPYLIAFGIGIGAYFAFFLLAMFPSVIGYSVGASEEVNMVIMIVTFAIGYLLFLLGFAVIRVLIFVQIQNYVWSVTNLGGHTTFQSEYQIMDLLKIEVTNGLAIFFSLGLALPWATIRRRKYVVEHLLVTLDEQELDKVIQSSQGEEAALGDAAADYLDFDIG